MIRLTGEEQILETLDHNGFVIEAIQLTYKGDHISAFTNVTGKAAGINVTRTSLVHWPR